MNKIRFCCAIIIYNPNREELDSITLYSNLFEFLYVFDNTENKNNNYLFCNKENVEYITDSYNHGLSYAYNIVCKKAIQKGFDYICLLDQDSCFSSVSINNIKNFIIKNNREDIGLYAPYVLYKNKKYEAKERDSEKIDWAISSGSFLSLKYFQKINGFDEFYFIDKVDFEYCQRLKKAGAIILQVNNSILEQNLGSHKSYLGFNFYQHSKIRHYYIFRNRIYYYLISQPVSVKNVLITVIGTFKHVLLILFSETDKLSKIKQFFKAFKSIVNYKRKR